MRSPGSAEHDVAAAQRRCANTASKSIAVVRVCAAAWPGLPSGLAERVRLRLAAPFRHRLREVREQHGEPEPERELEREARVRPRPAAMSRTSTTVVSTLPSSTTNITGFRTMCRGSQLHERVPARARLTMGGSKQR